MEVNIREARARISTLVERAQKGEEIMILRRGKRIARLVPVEAGQRSLPDLSSFRDSISEAIASAEGLPMVTADKALQQAAEALGVPVILLNS